MKAMVKESWAPAAPLVLKEFPDKKPRGRQARVRVEASSVNPADWKMLSSGAANLAGRLLRPGGGIRAGLDFAGIVDAVGPRVSRVKPGQAVAGISLVFLGGEGSYAEALTVHERMLCPLPEGMDLAAAGALPVAGYTAWRAVVGIARLGAGEKALILGASGGVGHLAVQIARHVRGGHVVGVCSAKNARLVKDLGADLVLDYGKGDPLAQAKEHGPFKLVMDCVGSYPAAGCRALLSPGGRHVNISPDGRGAVWGLASQPLKSRTLLGAPTGRQLAPLAEALATDRIKVIVAEKIPLAEIARAFALSQTGRTVGKIVVGG